MQPWQKLTVIPLIVLPKNIQVKFNLSRRKGGHHVLLLGIASNWVSEGRCSNPASLAIFDTALLQNYQINYSHLPVNIWKKYVLDITQDISFSSKSQHFFSLIVSAKGTTDSFEPILQ